jgi:hypothetical protein
VEVLQVGGHLLQGIAQVVNLQEKIQLRNSALLTSVAEPESQGAEIASWSRSLNYEFRLRLLSIYHRLEEIYINKSWLLVTYYGTEEVDCKLYYETITKRIKIYRA